MTLHKMLITFGIQIRSFKFVLIIDWCFKSYADFARYCKRREWWKPFPKIQEQNVRSSQQEAENNTPDQYKHHTVSIRACAL